MAHPSQPKPAVASGSPPERVSSTLSSPVSPEAGALARPALGVFAGLAVLLAVIMAAPLLMASQPPHPTQPTPDAHGAEQARQLSMEPKRWITADHSQHEALQKEFTSGPEVTAACLSCHNEAALQVHQTIHWTWKCPHDESGQMGKYGATLNNFCVAVPSNEPRCTSCHVGYGFKDASFDFNDPTRVDCLVCHDSTGTYKKFPSGAGYPVDEAKVFKGNGKTYYPPDWNKVAQSVQRPGRQNCGDCHFKGGGGDGVKHGDLDTSLLHPSRELDVHMATEGPDFSCVRCHTTEAHKIAGRCYKNPAATDRGSLIDNDQISRITCESCHTAKPHKPGVKANDHTDKVACQSCHIPTMARAKPTKTWWDWSKAGRMRNGKPYEEEGPLDRNVYVTKKGEFRWEMNIVPEYHFFNGSMFYLTLDDEIDATQEVALNWPVGEYDDADSRIYPFKAHRGKQPYDSELNRMVVPHLFGKDESAYWKSYDWTKAIASGQQAAGRDFSGEYDFVQTVYYYPTTHMVAPKEKSLACESCHSRDGRLANLAGFYLPGRDSFAMIDFLGYTGALIALLAVLGHGLLRWWSCRKQRSN